MRVGEYQRTVNKQGEKIYKFAQKNLLILRKGIFRKAGYFCWKDHIAKVGKAGIGLNPAIARMDLSKLLIFDRKANQFYHISDLEKAKRYKGRKKFSNSHVLVYPLSCFEEVVVEDQHHIVESPANCSRVDLKTRQTRLSPGAKT